MRPPGQGREEPGRWAKKPATHTIQEQAASAGQAMTAAGSLSRLAGTDQAPTEG